MTAGIPPSAPAASLDFAWLRGSPWRLIAFGLGAGLLRPGPGTWGTLLAWLSWQLVPAATGDSTIAGLLILAFLVGCVACERTGRDLGVPDHGGMVWDEVVAFWLVLWLVPDSLGAQAVAFVLFRFFDIAKPPPVRWADRHLQGGLGVMFDDLLAAGYTLLMMALLVRLGAWV